MKKRPSEKRHAFIICNGRKIILLKLTGFIQSSNVVLYLRCKNCFILRFYKILKSFVRYPTVFKLNCPSAMLFSLAQLLFLNVQQEKQIKTFQLVQGNRWKCIRKVLILCNGVRTIYPIPFYPMPLYPMPFYPTCHFTQCHFTQCQLTQFTSLLN